MQHEFATKAMQIPSQATTRTPGSVYEYQLVAYPNEALSGLIQEMRRQLSATHAVPVLSSRPLIEICRYHALESMEDTLSRWWQRLCGQKQSFTVVLNNIGGIPFKSIYLRVQHQQVFHDIQQQMASINDYLTSYHLPDIHKAKNPKVLLAQHLKESLYERAMFDYAHQEFHASFAVEELVLLKNEMGSNTTQRLQVFGLAPQLNHSLFETYPLIY